jgi:regulatory protein
LTAAFQIDDMKTITGLVPQKRGGRLNVYLDGRFAFGLSAEVALSAGLTEGRRLNDSEVDALVRQEERLSAVNAALRFLAYRPRSQDEVRLRLRRKGFSPALVVATLEQLVERGLLDDSAFARFWVENRTAFRPRSARLLSMELRRKGVPVETAHEALLELNEEDDAYRAARKKAESAQSEDYRVFRERIGSYLRRRGYSYDLAARTVDRLWQERRAAEGEAALTPCGTADTITRSPPNPI